MTWTYHGGGAPAGSENPVVDGNLTVTGDLIVGGAFSSKLCVIAPPPSGGDDYATIQALIDSYNPLAVEVRLQKGDYLTSAELRPAPGSRLLLSGSGHVYRDVGGTSLTLTQAARSVVAVTEKYSKIRQMRIDANRLGTYWLYGENCANLWLIDGAGTGGVLDGIHLSTIGLNQGLVTFRWFSELNGKTYATVGIIGQYHNTVVRQPVIAGTAATIATNDVITITGGPNITSLGIRTGYFGDMIRVSDGQTLSSLTSVGTTATGTTPLAHGWAPGQLVAIAGATPAAYNGGYTIATTPTATTFTYTFAGGASPATGTITANNATTSFYGQIFSVAHVGAGNDTVTLHAAVGGWPTRTISGQDYAICVGFGKAEELSGANGYAHFYDSFFRYNGGGGIFMNALYGDTVTHTLTDSNDCSGIVVGLISNNTLLIGATVESSSYMEDNVGPDFVIGSVLSLKIDTPSGGSPLFMRTKGGSTASAYQIIRDGTSENVLGKLQNLLLVFRRVGGVIKHQTVSTLTGFAALAADRVNGESATLAVTPIGASALDATHPFVSGVGIYTGTTNTIVLDTPGGYYNAGEVSGRAGVEAQKVSSGTQATLPLRVQLDMQAANINGVTRNRLVLIVTNGFTNAAADLTSGANGLPVDGDFIAIRFDGPIK